MTHPPLELVTVHRDVDNLLGRGDPPHLGELALRLSRIIRFGGEGSEPYSVLQHSLVVAELMEWPKDGLPQLERMVLGLLHDAHEPITGEVTYRYKCQEQSYNERPVQCAIWRRLGLSPEIPNIHADALRVADWRAGIAEMHLLGIKDAMYYAVDLKARELTRARLRSTYVENKGKRATGRIRRLLFPNSWRSLARERFALVLQGEFLRDAMMLLGHLSMKFMRKEPRE